MRCRIWIMMLLCLLALPLLSQEKRVTIELKDAPITEAFDQLFRAAGENFVLEPGVPTERRLTMRLVDIPFEKALNFLCDLAGLKWEKKDSVYVIGTAPLTREPAIMEVIRLRYLSVQDCASLLGIPEQGVPSPPTRIGILSFIPGLHRIIALPHQNVFLIYGTPEAIRQFRELLSHLDRPEMTKEELRKLAEEARKRALEETQEAVGLLGKLPFIGRLFVQPMRCPKCGTVIRRDCPQCKRTMLHDWRFCPYDGKELPPVPQKCPKCGAALIPMRPPLSPQKPSPPPAGASELETFELEPPAILPRTFGLGELFGSYYLRVMDEDAVLFVVPKEEVTVHVFEDGKVLAERKLPPRDNLIRLSEILGKKPVPAGTYRFLITKEGQKIAELTFVVQR